MKLSPTSLEVLDNFSGISNSMLFLEGKTQKIMTPSKTLFAQVELEEEIPKEFGIYNLKTFLALLSVFREPSINFDDKYLEISENTAKAKYFYCAPELIKHPPKDKELKLENPDISFELGKDTLDSLLKSARILNLPHLVVEGDGQDIKVSVKKADNVSSDNFSRTVGTTGENFSFILDIETLRMLVHDYDVGISKAGLVKFSSKQMKLTYFVPVQQS